MTKDLSFDVAIVGGGPGGYVAAIRAGQLGLKACVVEEADLGGICLNWGCIPTKALLRSADVFRLVKQAASFGIQVGEPTVNVPEMIKRSRQVAGRLSKGVDYLLKKNSVTVIKGRARIAGPGKLDVVGEQGKQSVSTRHIVLATGARARELPVLPFDGKTVWSYREALDPPKVPTSMVIIGAGAIGVEFACFYRTIGVDVTLVEMASHILPQEDQDVSELMATEIGKMGIKVLQSVSIQKARQSAGGWRIELSGGLPPLSADVVLVAAGIVGNVENLGLEHTKVKVDRSHIVTKPTCETDEPGVYAIGDVAGAPWLAHKASHEGVICIEQIAGLKPHPLNAAGIAACTYSHPQVASVGLSEKKAREQGHQIKVGKFPFSANGKALAMGDTTGFAKVVFDAKTGELLGAHLVGEEVTEMIQGYAVAQTLETTEAELMSTVFPHPTVSESMHEAVLAAYGRALHI